jgi:hypothetical protein
MTALLNSFNINLLLIVFCIISAVIYFGALAKAERKMQKTLAYISILLITGTVAFNFNTDFFNNLGLAYNMDTQIDASTQDFSLIEKLVFVLRQFLNLI